MTTTTTLARGSELGRQNITDGWVGYTNTPECTDHPRYEALIDALVDATIEAGNAALPDGVSWHPYLSEIVGPVGTELGDFDGAEFANAASEKVDYSAIEATVFGGSDAQDLNVQIEVSGDGGQIWQAVDAPTPVADTGFSGSPSQIADAVASDYRYTQQEEGAESGMLVRATVTRTINPGEISETVETVAVSDIHEITGTGA